MVKTPPKKVFWGCFGGLHPFSGGIWTLRDCFSDLLLGRGLLCYFRPCFISLFL